MLKKGTLLPLPSPDSEQEQAESPWSLEMGGAQLMNLVKDVNSWCFKPFRTLQKNGSTADTPAPVFSHVLPALVRHLEENGEIILARFDERVMD